MKNNDISSFLYLYLLLILNSIDHLMQVVTMTYYNTSAGSKADVTKNEILLPDLNV